MKRYIMYVNLVTVTHAYEDLERLPVIRIIDDGRNKYISKGLEEVAEAIVDLVPYLGSDYSELMPVVVEVWNAQETRLFAAIRPRKRRTERGAL